mgnify:CR=1 FL=1
MENEQKINEMGVRIRKMSPRKLNPKFKFLTPLLVNTLNYFWDYQKKSGFLPSYREAGRHFGVSYSAIEHRMWSLEQLGFIQKDYHTSRSFKFLKDKRSWRVPSRNKIRKMQKKHGMISYLKYKEELNNNNGSNPCGSTSV